MVSLFGGGENPDSELIASSGAVSIDEFKKDSLTDLWKKKIYDELIERLDLSRLGLLEHSDAHQNIWEVAHIIFKELNAPVNLEKRNRITREIIDELLGLGPLEKLLKDPDISDVLGKRI